MDAVLALVWLVFAHLVADFVLQNDWIAIHKGQGGGTGWLALLTHGGHVALCLVPVAFAFGGPGVAYIVVVTVSHVLVDRWKVRATRRAEAAAQAAARARLEATGLLPSTGLGNAWSPWPGMLFLADQLLHLTLATVGWVVLLEGAALLPGFVGFVDALLLDADRATAHAVILTTLVMVSLFLVNTRGAHYFLLALASPRSLQAADPAEPPPPSTSGAGPGAPTGGEAQLFAMTSAIERVLVVCAMLAGSILGVAVVLAFEVAARFRRLSDGGYADWWLLATTGSAGVAIASGLLGAAALASLAP